MKKMLVVLLSLAVAGGVFAIDLVDGFQITGEVKSGLAIFGQDDDQENGDDIYGKGYNDDAGENFRTRLDFTYDNDIGGAKVRLEALNGTAVTMEKAFGWVNLFNKMVVISGGHGVDDIFGVGGIVDDAVDGGDSARVAVNLLDNNLTIGAGLALTIDGKAKSLPNALKSWYFGASYKADFFQVIAAFRLNPGNDGTSYYYGLGADGKPSPTPVGENKLDHSETGDVDLYVDGVYGLKLPTLGPVGLDITGALRTGPAGYFRIAPLVTFGLGDAIEIHARADINVDSSDDGVDPDDGYSNFGTVEAESDASIGIRAGIAVPKIATTPLGAYLRIGSDNIAYFAGNGLYIRPGLTFAFGPNTNIEIYDHINRIGADDVAGKLKGASNQFGIDFNWSF
ncbi:hypothetical protein FACS189445_6730 [Spirochaetia bacterium]|nr:hypothetical protein FACS189445_6730 [Spirochaetia bacterium]